MSQVAFVTGGNRGIGLEFSRQLAARGWQVIAGYRTAHRSRELLADADNHPCLHAFHVDVNNQRQVRRLCQYVRRTFGRLDLLINNAGINPGAGLTLDEVSIDQLRSAYDVNVLGALLTARTFRPLLVQAEAPKIVNIGSRSGIIALSKGDNAPYRISKCALNMLTSIQAQVYRPDNIIVTVITPGWVRTDMGGPRANLTPPESVAAMLGVIDGLTMEQSGRFLVYDGEEVAL